MPDFTYDPVQHRYTLNGREIPGITRVLTDIGYGGRKEHFYTSASRQLGSAVHYAIECAELHCPGATYLNDVLDAIEIDERLHPYLEGYLLFKRDTGFTQLMTEQAVYSESILVGGQLDLYGSYPDQTRVVVDVKSWKSQGTSPKRSAMLQVNAYALMAQETLGVPVHGVDVLKLSGDGKYRRYACWNPRDQSLVRMAALLWWDLKTNKLLDIATGGEDDE